MNLVKYDDPILTTPVQQFDFKNPPFDPIEFAQELVRKLYEEDGYGLSAVQVGIPYHIFAMKGSPENFVCFNSKIVDVGDLSEAEVEGCLSIPGLALSVQRPKSIKVRFQTPNGEGKTEKYAGLTARVFQHEMDHQNGVLLLAGYGRAGLELAIKKAKKRGFEYSLGKLIKITEKVNKNLYDS